MKNRRKWIAAVMMISLIMAAPALAGKGACPMTQQQSQTQAGTQVRQCTQSQQQYCQQNFGQTCPLISEGEPVVITGTVYEDSYAGSGLILDTNAEENTVIYGIGPQWYWDQVGVSKPAVGETVTVDALVLTYSDGTQKIIATTITIGEISIDLRDVDGKPLWRYAGRQL